MHLEKPVLNAKRCLLSRRDLVHGGMHDRAIRAAVASGRLVRLRPGWYMAGEQWDGEYPAARHAAAIVATQNATGGSLVYSHRSAATLHRLPVWMNWLESVRRARRRPDQDQRTVHVTCPASRGSSRNSALYVHRCELEEGDVGGVLDLRVTTAERTIFDIARTEPFEVALACADEHLRLTVRRGRRVDEGAWQAWSERMRARAERIPGGRGVRAVRAVAGLADPRADSPLESVSRLRFMQLGIDVELQVEVADVHGGRYFLDFLMREHGCFGESDGKAKYFDAELRGSRTIEEAIYAEKLRQNAVENAIGMRGLRWGAREVGTAEAFARWLEGCGIPVPRCATGSFGPEVAEFLDSLPQKAR